MFAVRIRNSMVKLERKLLTKSLAEHLCPSVIGIVQQKDVTAKKQGARKNTANVSVTV